ncbi:MAG: hypothetical protein ABSB22_04460 [Thermodesulfobacteriota bacterium]|jgi:hypothetical protein
MEKELTATYDKDSKRFHRFIIDENQGIVGNIYVPKSEPVPERVTVSLKTKDQK